jgi:hypothetical protein
MTMNVWKASIGGLIALEIATLGKWLFDGRQILTKQQMAIEKLVRDEVFGTTVSTTEFVNGFWLGLDIVVPIVFACSICAGFCFWQMRRTRTVA